MKQVLLVLLLTALGAVGFVVTRKLTAEAPDGTASNLPGGATGSIAATEVGRPTVPDSGKQTREAPELEVIRGAEVEKTLQERRSFPWKEVIDQERVVSLDEAWSLDLSGVDFEADVLLELDGRPVTRDEFQRFVVTDLGSSLVEARLGRDLVVHQARERGFDVELPPEVHARMIELAAAERGMDVNTFMLSTSITARLPVSAMRHLRELAIESTLGYAIGTDEATDLPSLFLRSLPDDNARDITLGMVDVVETNLAKLRTALAAGEAPAEEILIALNDAVDGLAMSQSGPRQDELAFRSWTWLDVPQSNALPPGAAAGVYLGELPAGTAQLPWSLGDESERSFASVKEVWELVGQGLTRDELERSLSDLLYILRLRGVLADMGASVDLEQAWNDFIEEYEASKRAALSMVMIRRAIEGFPSFAHVRAIEGLRSGFLSTLPDGWDSEESLRETFEKNRFLIEFWQPGISMIVFPAFDPNRPDVTSDWEYARNSAIEARERIHSGESFDALRAAQHQAVAEALTAREGETKSQGFLGTYDRREIMGNVNSINQLLGHTVYRNWLRTTSVPASAAAYLEEGEVSQPWRTPVGYVLVRLNDAYVGELENEFEDVEGAVLDFDKRSRYLTFANEQMTSAVITLPDAQ